MAALATGAARLLSNFSHFSVLYAHTRTRTRTQPMRRPTVTSARSPWRSVALAVSLVGCAALPLLLYMALATRGDIGDALEIIAVCL